VTLAELNALDEARFVDALGGIFEHSAWVAKAVAAHRPFLDVAGLHAAMVNAVTAAPARARLDLIRAHPELAGKAAVSGALTVESTREQAGAGLAHCSPQEFARLHELNDAYNAKFGFPFIVAVKGLDRTAIIEQFARRVQNDPGVEMSEALAQIGRIARFRLDALLAA
jgi:2-oxo-4-hydroxy-4-carboxy-5-ureidoimidazoline decarboxylase